MVKNNESDQYMKDIEKRVSLFETNTELLEKRKLELDSETKKLYSESENKNNAMHTDALLQHLDKIMTLSDDYDASLNKLIEFSKKLDDKINSIKQLK